MRLIHIECVVMRFLSQNFPASQFCPKKLSHNFSRIQIFVQNFSCIQIFVPQFFPHPNFFPTICLEIFLHPNVVPRFAPHPNFCPTICPTSKFLSHNFSRIENFWPSDLWCPRILVACACVRSMHATHIACHDCVFSEPVVCGRRFCDLWIVHSSLRAQVVTSCVDARTFDTRLNLSDCLHVMCKFLSHIFFCLTFACPLLQK